MKEFVVGENREGKFFAVENESDLLLISSNPNSLGRALKKIIGQTDEWQITSLLIDASSDKKPLGHSKIAAILDGITSKY